MINLKDMKNIFKSTKNKIRAVICGIILIGIFIAALIVKLITSPTEEEVVYKETTVSYGDLTVGITEDSTVDIGTVEQTFSLDISSLVTSDSSSTTTSTTTATTGAQAMGMGGQSTASTDMFSQMFSLAESSSQTTTTDSENSMEVESVVVTVGKRIEVGDVLYTLTQDSVNSIRNQLASDVELGLTDLEELETEQISTKLTAEHTYETTIAYGAYAKTEYEETVKSLNEAITDKEEELTLAQEELASLNEKLVDYQAELIIATENLNAAQANVDATDQANSTYWYMQYEAVREEAQTYLDTIENSIESTMDSIEKAEENIETITKNLNKAKRDLPSGLLQAKETYDLRMLAYNNAQETFDVATAYLALNVASAEATYEEAQEKLSEFDEYIVEQAILSEYSGLVTDVALSAGDSVSMDTVMITLYDDEAVTMTATVEEEDMTAVALEDEVNIVLTAYEDSIFTGIVTEISDATYNSNTGVNEYSVTVTLQGDVTGLYQGMSGDITFITKESEKVVYVSNRAIFRDGAQSYVKVMDDNGNIVEKDVTTGFSDGINVEIVEGLSEGDVVLIESKVSE